MDVIQIVAGLLDLVLKLVGPEKAKAQLSEAEVRLTNLAADAAELAKFGEVSR